MRTFFALVLLAIAACTTTPTPSNGQSGSGVKQSGNVTPGHPAQWTTNGTIQDGGIPTNGSLTGVGVTAVGPGFCQNSGPITGPYQQLCLGVTSSQGSLSLTALGGASAIPLNLCTNGTCVSPNGGLAGLTVGVTLINGGNPFGVLFQSGAVLGETTPGANCILLTNGSNQPSCATTLSNTFTFTAPNNADALVLNGYNVTGSASANELDISGAANTSGTAIGENININFTSCSGTCLLERWQNNAITVASMDVHGALSITPGSLTASDPSLNITQTWNSGGVIFTGELINITNTASAAGSRVADFQVSSASMASVGVASDLYVGHSGQTTIGSFTLYGANSGGGNRSIVMFDAGTPNISVAGQVCFAGGATDAGSADTCFIRDGATGIIGQRNGTAPETFRVYNTFTDSTHYERGTFDWNISANVLTIGTEKGSGGGSIRDIQFIVGGTDRLDYDITVQNQWSMFVNHIGGLTIYTGLSGTPGNYNIDDIPGGSRMMIMGTLNGGNTAWGMVFSSDSVMAFGNLAHNGGDIAGTQDTGISRDSAGVIDVGNGTTGDSSGTLKASHGTFTALANVATTSAVCYNTGTGVLTYDGTIGTCNTSTMRVKHDIQPLFARTSLDDVLAMKPVSFYYNDSEHTPGQQLGLVAEDLAEIDQRLVSYDDTGQPHSIRFLGPMFAKLIGAIQEQQREIETLQRRQ